MPYALDGETLAAAPFVIDDVQYPANVLDLWPRGDLEALGLVWVDPTMPEPHAPTAEELCVRVDEERDRRIDDGFMFEGHRFQSRPSDRENIAALGIDALEAIRLGAEAGDYMWHPLFPDGFGFITQNNETVPLDAYQMRDLRTAGMAFKGALTFYARALKDAVIAAGDGGAVDIKTGWPE